MFNPTWFYVGAIYAIAVWIARRYRVDLPWRIAALFYALVLIYLWAPLTSDVVNLPVDFIQGMVPWAFLKYRPHVQNTEINDIVLQMVPWAHLVRESWRSGHVPLWNSFSGSGYPLLANGQSAALSLLRLLALPLPLGQSFAAEAAMKLLIALTFTYLFCRRRYSEIASATGAISFAFCTFIIVWLHFPHSTVAVFAPAVLYQIDLLAERRTYPRFVIAAVIWTLMIFSGHPETVAHVFVIALLYVLWVAFVERRGGFRFVATLVVALAIAGVLAAPFLAPLAEAITKSDRYNALQVQRAPVGLWTDWPAAILLAQPGFFGHIPLDKPWKNTPKAESITGFAGVLGLAAWFALAIHVIRRRRWRSTESFLLLATLFVLGVILGWPGVSQLFNAVFKLAANARLRFLLCLLLSIQTAALVDLMTSDARAALAGIAIFAAALAAIFYSTTFPNDAARDTTFLAMIPSIAVLVIAAMAAAARRYTNAVVMVLVVGVVAEVWAATNGWNPTISAELMYPATPLIEKLQALKTQQPPNAPFRIAAPGPMFFPNVSSIYGLEDIRAHDPMANARYLGVLRVVTGYDTELYFPQWANVNTPVLDFLNVKYVIMPPRTDPHDSQRYSLVYDGRDGRIFENHDVLPRFYPTPVVILEFKNDRYVHQLQTNRDWVHTALLKALPVRNDQERTDLLAPRPASASKATLHIVSARPDDYVMHVDAPRYSFIVSSIPFWPGWKVEADGAEINPLHVNGAFTGFVVPPGHHEVHVWYAPATFWGGVWLSFATIVVLVALRFRGRISPPAPIVTLGSGPR